MTPTPAKNKEPTSERPGNLEKEPTPARHIYATIHGVHTVPRCDKILFIVFFLTFFGERSPNKPVSQPSIICHRGVSCVNKSVCNYELAIHIPEFC